MRQGKQPTDQPFTLWQWAAWNYAECPAKSYFAGEIMMETYHYWKFDPTQFNSERKNRISIFRGPPKPPALAVWIQSRIDDLTIQADQAAETFEKTGEAKDLNTKISKSAQLKAFYGMRDYINTHPEVLK